MENFQSTLVAVFFYQKDVVAISIHIYLYKDSLPDRTVEVKKIGSVKIREATLMNNYVHYTINDHFSLAV